ncbi:peptidoglycan-binding domain-containing protein [Streptomyces liliifuscus]|uniref:Peptidoglycan-binding protein n=1 Tax=Streptomyces liliifuscus TaxID=2797636 RepID=A0A7T7REF6_9ACTN|nr:peptidoglycan-binding domain-containing protein [Streptomyces liliifuscus]QQM43606.1 peptidoglycan-binding protein [Streptomyces liliifuscus]
MNDRNGHICPECGAPWESGGSPTCDCGRRAADALLETRSAEAAAAEDFDPLRIRPYVDLAPPTPEAADSAASATPEPPAGTPGAPAADGTAYEHGRGHEHEHGYEQGYDHGYGYGAPSEPPPTSEMHEREPADAAATAQLPRATALPHSPSPDRSLFEEAHRLDPAEEPTEGTGRRRRFALVGAGATAAVVAAAGFASGLFSYDAPSRESAAPDDIRASVPDATLDEPSPSVSESPTRSPSPSPTESSSASATPSPTRSTASPAPPRPTATTRAPSTGAPTPTTSRPSTPPEKAEPVTLRRGDEGPEVTELQQRLQQVALFAGTPDGDYDNKTETAVRNYQLTRGINNEDAGTYDKETRTRLESETTEP